MQLKYSLKKIIIFKTLYWAHFLLEILNNICMIKRFLNKNFNVTLFSYADLFSTSS